jgi:hypothetical protein
VKGLGGIRTNKRATNPRRERPIFLSIYLSEMGLDVKEKVCVVV